LGFGADAVVGSGFMGMIRGNADLGFGASAVVGPGFMGMIRGNADLGFGAGAVVGFGAGGLIRENVDSRVGADAAARWSGVWTRSRNRDLGAAKAACRGLALRRQRHDLADAVRVDAVGRDGHAGKIPVEIGHLVSHIC
jgi:hypothetical protein